jgi:hypothetical protein
VNLHFFSCEFVLSDSLSQLSSKFIMLKIAICFFWHVVVPYLNSLTAFLANPFFSHPYSELLFLVLKTAFKQQPCHVLEQPCHVHDFIFFLLSIDNPFPHEPVDLTLLHQRAFYPSSPLEILPLTHS